MELLLNGLTFDLRGLTPAAPTGPPPIRHRYGLAADADVSPAEAVALAPGPHLGAGRAMPPVIRGAAALAASLAELEGVREVCWHAAGSAVGRDLFVTSVAAWLGGGAFPALGLTSLFASGGGRLCSEGLTLFIGQELCVEPGGGSPADDAKLALRLIDRLVAHGRVTAPAVWPLDATSELRLEPDKSTNTVRAWRRNV